MGEIFLSREEKWKLYFISFVLQTDKHSGTQPSIKGWLPSKVIFQQRYSTVKGHLSSKLIFNQRMSSNQCPLPSKVIFYQRKSSIKGSFPSKVFLKQSSPSIKGYLPSKFGDNMVKNSPNLWPTLSFFGIVYSSFHELGFWQLKPIRPGHSKLTTVL